MQTQVADYDLVALSQCLFSGSGFMLRTGDRASPSVRLCPLGAIGAFDPFAVELPALWCVQRALRILDDPATVVVDDPNRATEQDLQMAGREAANVARWRGHLDTLDASGVTSPMSRQDALAMGVVLARYFAVIKTVVPREARAIVNCMELNRVCPMPSGLLRLASVQNLIRCLLSVPTMRVVVADFKNYYYQIRLKKVWRRFFALWDGQLVHLLQVLPMGFNWACFIAQSLTWGIVFRHCPHLWPDGMGEFAPGDVKAKDGCHLFVIYDTILVACPSVTLAEAWLERLRSAAHNVAVFKYLDMPDLQHVGGHDRGVLYFEHNGVGFRVEGGKLAWRVAEATFAAWQEFSLVERGFIKDTPRTLYRLLGMIRRHREVHWGSARPFAAAARHQAALASKGIDDWEAFTADPQVVSGALTMIRGMQNPWTHQRSHLTPACAIYIAAFFDAVPTHWGYVIDFPDGRTEIDHGSLTTRDIHDAESFACGKVRKRLHRESDFCVYCGDNMVATSAYARGYS
jgi:hypothetical protein